MIDNEVISLSDCEYDTMTISDYNDHEDNDIDAINNIYEKPKNNWYYLLLIIPIIAFVFSQYLIRNNENNINDNQVIHELPKMVFNICKINEYRPIEYPLKCPLNKIHMPTTPRVINLMAILNFTTLLLIAIIYLVKQCSFRQKRDDTEIRLISNVMTNYYIYSENNNEETKNSLKIKINELTTYVFDNMNKQHITLLYNMLFNNKMTLSLINPTYNGIYYDIMYGIINNCPNSKTCSYMSIILDVYYYYLNNNKIASYDYCNYIYSQHKDPITLNGINNLFNLNKKVIEHNI